MKDAKAFFEAGLAMERTRETLDKNRKAFFRIAQERCPEELAACEAAQKEFVSAKDRFIELIKEKAHDELEQHIAECTDPDCGMKAALDWEKKTN